MFAGNTVNNRESVVFKRNADLSAADAGVGSRAVIHGPAEHTAGVDASAELAGFLCSSQILGRLIQNSLECLRVLGIVVAPLVQRCLGILDPGVACELCDLRDDEPAAAVTAQSLPAGEVVQLAVSRIAMDLNDFFAKGIHDALTILCKQIVERHQVAVGNVLRLVDQPAGPRKVNAFAGSQNLRELFAVLIEGNVDEFNRGVGNVLLELLIESGPDLVGVGLLAGAGDHELNGLLLKRGLFRLFGGLLFGRVGGVVSGRFTGCRGIGSLSGFAGAACQNAQNHNHGKKQTQSFLFHVFLLKLANG